MKKTELTVPSRSKWSAVCFLAAFCGCAIVLASSFWEWKPYTEWSEQETLALLTHSPWAKQQTLVRTHFRQWTNLHNYEPWDCPCRYEDDVAVFPLVVTRQLSSKYYVRFESAAPIRRAVARLSSLTDRISVEEVEELARSDQFDGYIVVAVTAFPELAQSELNTVTTASLQASNCLLHLEKSKTGISLFQYVSPLQAGTRAAYFVFARDRDGHRLLTADERYVSFDCRLSEQVRLACEFRLEKMLFEGKLEI
jgi:hypothetical protein